jgi:hypothetical protein
MSNNLALLISIASLVVSCLALLIAFWRYRIAKRTLELAVFQASAKGPNLVPYLIDGFVLPLEGRNTKVYTFSVSISNRSDNKNALSALDLRITYTRDDHTIGDLLLRHDNALKNVVKLPGAPSFSIPQEVSAHQTVAGWALFEIDNSLLIDKDVEGYKILFRDSHGLETHLESIILQEIEYEKEMA